MASPASESRAVSVSLRCATDEDRAAVLRLEEDAMRPYAEALWSGWQPSATINSLDLGGHEMIELSGRTVGCIACLPQSDHLRISKLYISTEFRNRGVGSEVLRIKKRYAGKQGLPLRLSVMSTNPDARRFYEREGFVLNAQTAECFTYAYPPPTPPA
jgi:ribosomal protein S18 acetylase RimI-like enzyme